MHFLKYMELKPPHRSGGCIDLYLPPITKSMYMRLPHYLFLFSCDFQRDQSPVSIQCYQGHGQNSHAKQPLERCSCRALTVID
ncbi:hypothetical protein GDO81_027930 [Engystomops pustulosus]|uniref:Uncharacterized protein n=1 Tax=Engystomops pustulosus TaxID=76066 RepID=A0AAV6ZN46_ENGPU|nr:hypothetical protein GDO81_027930 [Engystomops pustulosus]